MPEDTYRGSCLCGSVTYAFDKTPPLTVACHCSRCRKLTGTAFGTWALVPKDNFRWLSGEDVIAEFQSSEPGRRLFCQRCGTTLASLHAGRPQFMHVAAGTLDTAPQVGVAFHAHVASKATWHEITDSLPQHDAEPSSG